VRILGRQKASKKLAAPAHDVHRDAGPQKGRHRLGGNLHGFNHDQPFEITNRDLPENFLALGLFIAPEDFQTLTFQVDAAVGLIDNGGGHVAQWMRERARVLPPNQKREPSESRRRADSNSA